MSTIKHWNETHFQLLHYIFFILIVWLLNKIAACLQSEYDCFFFSFSWNWAIEYDLRNDSFWSLTADLFVQNNMKRFAFYEIWQFFFGNSWIYKIFSILKVNAEKSPIFVKKYPPPFLYSFLITFFRCSLC